MDKKTWRQTISEELKKLSGMTFGQKLEHIVTYYKMLFVVLFLILIGIYIASVVIHNMQQTEVLGVYLVNDNSAYLNTQAVADTFKAHIGGLGKNEVVVVDDSLTLTQNDMSDFGMANQMKFVAATSSGSVDVMIVDRENFESLQKQSYFIPLNEVFTAEELQNWSDRLAYREKPKPFVEPENPEEMTEVPLEEFEENEISSDYHEETPKNDEECYGIRVEDSIVFIGSEAYTGKAAYAGIVANTQHTEMSKKFIEFLLIDEEELVNE